MWNFTRIGPKTKRISIIPARTLSEQPGLCSSYFLRYSTYLTWGSHYGETLSCILSYSSLLFNYQYYIMSPGNIYKPDKRTRTPPFLPLTATVLRGTWTPSSSRYCPDLTWCSSSFSRSSIYLTWCSSVRFFTLFYLFELISVLLFTLSFYLLDLMFVLFFTIFYFFDLMFLLFFTLSYLIHPMFVLFFTLFHLFDLRKPLRRNVVLHSILFVSSFQLPL